MKQEHDELTHAVEAWLDTTEPSEDPATLFERVIGQLDAMPQRRSSWLARRSPVMSNPIRIALAVAAVIVLGLVTINLLPSGLQPGGGPAPSSSAAAGTDLGVFEPVRGRIVYRVDAHLEAVDPDDTSSPVEIDAEGGGLWAAMPAGFSADGSKLAISNEHYGDLFVMNRTGSLERVADLGICCAFVTSAWMSPDGTERLELDPSGRLEIIDMRDNRVSRVIDVEPIEPTQGDLGGQPSMPAWSQDGSQVAYVWSKGGDHATPAVGIVDLTSGVSRELISGWGYVRQVAWSPDGSQILVVAGPDAPIPSRSLNPLVHSHPASLYLVDIDDGEPHEVASGHYVAAAWSPDGTRIAAVDFYAGNHRVVVVNADGSLGYKLLAELGSDIFTGVVWHPVPAP